MDAKWYPLYERLREQPSSTMEVTYTFAEIDKILAPHKLPKSGREYFTYWGNWKREGSRSRAWLDAGFKMVMVDLQNEKVKFKRREEV